MRSKVLQAKYIEFLNSFYNFGIVYFMHTFKPIHSPFIEWDDTSSIMGDTGILGVCSVR